MAGHNFRLSKDEIFENVIESKIFTAALVLFLGVLLVYWKWGKKKYNFPPGPTGVPILGYLPFLGQEPHRELARLSKKYGNVFSLYMGKTYAVVLGDNDAVKEGLGKSTTLIKPDGLFDFLPDGLGFSSINGPAWTEQRRFCMKSMRDLGVGKDRWETITQAEVEDFVTLVSSLASKGQPIEICETLTSSVSNNMSSFVFGKRLERNDPDRKLLDTILDELMKYFNQTDITSYFPILRDISIALGIGRFAAMNINVKKFNHYVRKEAAKFKESYKNDEHENFIVDYLREMDNCKDKPVHFFNDINMHGNVQALFLGGSETTRTSIHWLLLIMAQFPKIQQEVHKEIDSVLGKHGRIQWAQRDKVPYTHATVLEGQRWRTIAPLNSVRQASEDLKIQGYDILKGTSILVNNWGLHNDTRYWKDPETFNPKRFLTENGTQVIKKPESYNPFSYGKRNCPGEVIALTEILHYFTALMQKFTVLPPEGKELDLVGNLGLTYMANKQELQFIPRE